jgi:hypothetical protein
MLVTDSSDLPARKIEAEYEELMQRIEEKDLKEWVWLLSEPRNFTAQPEENRATANRIAAQLKSWGYDAGFQGPY